MNLLITGAWQQAQEYIAEIEKMGHEVQFLQYEKDVLPCSYEWVEGIVGNGIFLTHPIERFVDLRYIQLTSAGFDRVPMDYARAHGITIKNARGVYSAPMAEYAVAGVLSLYKRQRFFAEKQKAHLWEKRRDLRELSGQTVCILGCGSVGSECAKRFEAFDCNVLGVDTAKRAIPHFMQVYPLHEMNKALAQADIIVLTLPLTEQTFHILDERSFEVMRSGAVIVNIARGALIDTEALIRALNHKLGGAVLDVFEEEPLGESPLWDMENVIVTPHNSFVGDKNSHRLTTVILNNLGEV